MAEFTPDFLDELRARLRASDVIGRHVKLKKEGREWRGLSPFTAEKTPSFFVNDEKARWFDFSSNKNGDIIGFLMEVQKLTFPEAVERLADEAGLQIPRDSPQERQRAEAAKGLAEACAAAARFYRTMLGRDAGAGARDYLDRRKVSQAARDAFGLGYAPDSKTALKDHLLARDFPLDLLVEAGLLIRLDDGTTYDRFRDRLMFPILGTQSRVIAFGGRALSSQAKAKYLNSPETPLFHKGHVLYDYARARKRAGASVGGGRPLVVAEGYMDVIAIAGIGLPAVAPLGTALTEGQLALLWRAADEPVLCFDGDRAGVSAAYRAVDRALPMLAPGKSLRFAFLPDGMDPDDLIKRDGAGAFEKVLGEAKPLAEVLWQRHLDTHPRGTPEEQAAFKTAAWSLVKEIKNDAVNEAYGGFLRGKLDELLGSTASSRSRTPAKRLSREAWLKLKNAPQVSADLKARGAPPGDAVREAQLVLTLIHHPGLFANHEDAVLELTLEDEALRRLHGRALDWLMGAGSLDSAALTAHLLSSPGTKTTYERWAAHPLVRLARFTGPKATLDEAEEGWLNALSIDRYQGDLEGEVDDAAREAHLDASHERAWIEAFNHRQRLLAENKPDDDEG